LMRSLSVFIGLVWRG